MPQHRVEDIEELAFHIALGVLDNAQQLNRIERKLNRLIHLEDKEMASLEALTAEVGENTDAVASAATLLGSLSQLIRDNATDPAALSALADQLDANNNELSAAIVENTPATTEPTDPNAPVDPNAPQA